MRCVIFFCIFVLSVFFMSGCASVKTRKTADQGLEEGNRGVLVSETPAVKVQEVLPEPQEPETNIVSPELFEQYTVKKGDTLERIAKRLLGKASKWRMIYDANRDKISDPSKIYPGQVLSIPAPGDTGGGDVK